ncbi:hypothetical protein [Deinococcus cellulosilyticus]|uniref:Uncharacterized protein n=1 Tax=Deinococcus cellulosilyticus (strain DSM 18568 / NBRC 106333 / KACC 11606 / 5516J-15) TaxID=1223518 RepID=A0A511NB82_DEIC1|nr:hypothetical protein [Deinococcus cellulosilyticus]GEM49847.1 hypothetical protein DC3_54820 [Deinococcus cellulosilyticus NBRC 106333 = KACC 11606]
MAVRLALNSFLKANGLTAYKLHKQTQGEVGRASIFALARGDVKHIDLNSLYHILNALSVLLDRPVQLQELFEVELDPNRKLKLSRAGAPYTGTPETDELYDAFPDILDRFKAAEQEEGEFLSHEDLFGEGAFP